MGSGCIFDQPLPINPAFHISLSWYTWLPVPEYNGELYDYSSRLNFQQHHPLLSATFSTLAVLDLKTRAMLEGSGALARSSQGANYLAVCENIAQQHFQIQTEGGNMWQVLPTADFKTQLKAGDVLKMGKVVMNVTKVCLPKKPVSVLTLQSKFSCRICLENQYRITDPLLEPCECKGSMAKIHLSCLKKYILVDTSQRGKTCSICGQSFKSTYLISGQVKDIFEQGTVVDSYDPNKPHIGVRILYKTGPKELLFNFESGQSRMVGRMSHSDIRIDDSNVSRNHLSIQFDGTYFYAKDLGSRFGSLIKRPDRLNLGPGQPLRLQINNNYFQLLVKSTLPKISTPANQPDPQESKAGHPESRRSLSPSKELQQGRSAQLVQAPPPSQPSVLAVQEAGAGQQQEVDFQLFNFDE